MGLILSPSKATGSVDGTLMLRFSEVGIVVVSGVIGDVAKGVLIDTELMDSCREVDTVSCVGVEEADFCLSSCSRRRSRFLRIINWSSSSIFADSI